MSMPDQPQRGLLPALGWACYLGSSWTWVIGMFFPILLLRDYGLWGWIVFAVPNVVGAAAMGWVLTPESSRRIMHEHRWAVQLFAVVTILFHFAVLSTIDSRFIGSGMMLPLLVVITLAFVALMWRPRNQLPIAVIVTGLSLMLFCIWLFQSDAWPNLSGEEGPPRLGIVPLLLFVPASIAGFTLCPYLDVTFHRARQSTDPRTGRFAFTLGFSVVFLAMILFSLSYAQVMEPLFGFGSARFALPLALILAAHFVMQSTFTCAAHITCYRRISGAHAPWKGIALGIAIALFATAPLVLLYAPPQGVSRLEALYRGYLLFYGLIFPAYVWLCMIPSPWKGRTVSPSRERLVFVAATIIALPMAFAGFVMGISWWIPVSLGVLVLARGLLEVISIPAKSLAADERG